jgi:hypothetical protein
MKEIIPSSLPIDNIPTRLGYVIRCSNKVAVYKENQTFIFDNEKLIKLEEPEKSSIRELKTLYFKENTTEEMIEYNGFNFSLNDGDYKKPIF